MRELAAAMRPPGATAPDYSLYPPAKVLAYLVAWSLVDASGALAPISAGAIELLEASTFTELTTAIEAHEAAREREKKTTTTIATAAAPILQSVG